MLSIGIRSGQGFDKNTLKKLIDNGSRPYEFDYMILGTNPGGIVCARELIKHNMKTAVIFWRNPTPGELEGQDEDRYEMSKALEFDGPSITSHTRAVLEAENKMEILRAIKFSREPSVKVSQVKLFNETKTIKWQRKVRRSRLDLKNAIRNMASEGMQYMHEMAVRNHTSLGKNSSVKPMSISWGRMMEHMQDYIIRRNWDLLTDLIKNKISIYCGFPDVLDEHTVKILKRDGEERVITAGTIISAVEVPYSFPKDVIGAREFGVNCDDFFRLSSSPGKTLVVGAGSLGLECAGILSSFSFPVVVVDRSAILKNGDHEIVDLIVKDLASKGVKFLAENSLVSIHLNQTGHALSAEFRPVSKTNASTKKKKYSEEFDTILFATREKFQPKKFRNNVFGMEIEKSCNKTSATEDENQNIIEIPHRPGKKTLTQLIGKHVAEQLLGVEKSPPNFKFIPQIILTPREYAYVGASEKLAKSRLGEECVDVFTGYFQTGDILENECESEVCFAKVIVLSEKDLIIGLHFLGKDVVQVVYKVLDSVRGAMTVSNIHPVIASLLSSPTKIKDLGDE